jgi:hypothetical protein
MREADRVFEKVGGSTRHHVRDCLLPVLNRNGWRVVRDVAQSAATTPEEQPANTDPLSPAPPASSPPEPPTRELFLSAMNQVLTILRDLDCPLDVRVNMAHDVADAALRSMLASSPPERSEGWRLPQVCLVCNGVGILFPNQTGRDKAHCRACGGTGRIPALPPEPSNG